MYSNNLYEARKQARKTQAELAEMLAMNTIVYGRYERGERDIPLSVAVQMADVLNVSLDYLAGRSRIASGTKSDDRKGNERCCKWRRTRRSAEEAKMKTASPARTWANGCAFWSRTVWAATETAT